MLLFIHVKKMLIHARKKAPIVFISFVITLLALHYSNATMSAMASQITAVSIFTQPFLQVYIKENIKVPRQWPLLG